MKSTFFTFLIFACLISCTEENPNNLIINGDIDGLRVGTVKLQKIQDTTLVTLDSIALDGTSKFTLSTSIEEPQLLYLYLDVKDGTAYDDRLSFFAQDTIMTVKSSLQDFEKDAVITGSKNNELLTEFRRNMASLNKTYTELVKRSMALDRQENASQAAIDALNADYETYLNKKVKYALSYATVHKEYEVAPFILLEEGFDANPVFLDSVYQQMPKKIQTSLYGKELSELIKDLKEI
ncbi:DUF4369 domain-containing protein [Nonlabens marinus]|uniref:DUF4369 domain-containing protein n=1 Tax=Nonlabens marinus TaxID=930802 RepID=UPI0005A27968|nr:DUF4369 domain-containing protein [Nonlabens marinus]